ncbi:MAG: hypothetical protein ACI9UA_003534 [Pseudoalteromonas tetraodonis]
MVLVVFWDYVGMMMWKVRRVVLALIGFVAHAAAGQLLVVDYQFNDTLASAVGTAASLEQIGEPIFQSESVDGVDQRVLAFAAGEGCRLLNASQTLGEAHTIVVLFRFDSNSSWRRVLDYRNRKTDWGLYSYYGNLNFYNVTTGIGGAIQPDNYVQIALTRNEQGTVRGYVNGVPEIDFHDSGPNATLDVDDILTFFQDDTVVSGEHSAGAVSRIRIWDDALSEADIAALDRSPGGELTAPPVITSQLATSVVTGQPLEYAIAASNDPVSYSATNMETWMSLDSQTGIVSGTAGNPGVYDVGISAFNAGGSASRTLRITVDPAVGGTLGFSVAEVRVSEAGGMLEVTVVRRGDASGQATVNYATRDGSALSGENYGESSGLLTFEDGETEQVISIDLLFNPASEEDKDFALVLSDFVNAAGANPIELRVVIEDAPVRAPEIGIVRAVGVRWMALPAVRYRVMWSSNLEAGPWMVLEDEIVNLLGAEVTVFDEIVSLERFYRVEVME